MDSLLYSMLLMQVHSMTQKNGSWKLSDIPVIVRKSLLLEQELIKNTRELWNMTRQKHSVMHKVFTLTTKCTGIPYMEASAKTGENVDEIFFSIAREVKRRFDEINVQENQPPVVKKKSCVVM